MNKLIILTTIGQLAQAGLQEMETSFQKLIENHKFSENNATLTEIVTNYGCWCSSVAYNHKTNPGITTNLVQKKPVDEIDNACKILMDSYDCTILDEECKSPNATTYKLDVASSHKLACKKLGNTCEKNVCAVEQHFVASLVRMIKKGGAGTIFNEQNLHTSGFSHENNCEPEFREVKGKNSRKCWGAFPKRFPYEVQKHLAMAYIGGI